MAPSATHSGEMAAGVSSIQDSIPAKVTALPSGAISTQTSPVTNTATAPAEVTALQSGPSGVQPLGSNAVQTSPVSSGTATAVKIATPVANSNAPPTQMNDATPPAITIKEESLKEFQLAMLREHNSMRIRHESKLLELDANLNAVAGFYARSLAQNPPLKGAYSLLPGGIGQNTYTRCGKSLRGAEVTKIW
ncbi:uncharacterized protein LOC114532761 [Dendronephthya gigantea]|uniref:uncharacterized protein LOC114532761 n=1 Tax=Dendronephthya gigantea TaxID=151771 RepID=UPI00106B54BB|nr:uncharacterized protein LOC114532761 [Dendronephthya gigantea]